MNEAERRQEILQVEEVIRQLAGEMAHASESAAWAEEARRKLEEAGTVMNQAKQAFDEATRVIAASGDKAQAALTSVSGEAVKSLAEVSEHLNELGTHIMAAIERLQAVTQAVEATPERLVQVLRSQLSPLTSLVRWALVFAALAVVGAGISTVLVLIRTG